MFPASKTETGGLSGVPIKPISLKALRTLRGLLPANIPIIGSGGIWTGQDALDYAKSGAQMVQIYTSFGYNGVGTCRRIKDELVDLLAREGKTWDQVVKEAVEKHSLKEPEKKPSTMDQLVSEAEELKSYLRSEDKKGNSQEGQKEDAQEKKTGADEMDLRGAAEVSVI